VVAALAAEAGEAGAAAVEAAADVGVLVEVDGLEPAGAEPALEVEEVADASPAAGDDPGASPVWSDPTAAPARGEPGAPPAWNEPAPLIAPEEPEPPPPADSEDTSEPDEPEAATASAPSEPVAVASGVEVGESAADAVGPEAFESVVVDGVQDATEPVAV